MLYFQALITYLKNKHNKALTVSLGGLSVAVAHLLPAFLTDANWKHHFLRKTVFIPGPSGDK